MELYKMETTVALKKSEKRKIMELQEEYGFCASAIIFHIAHYAACSLIKKKTFSIASSHKDIICRYSLYLYQPFSFNIKNPEMYGISYSFNFTYEALKEKLKQAGILEPCLFFASIVRTIIKFPDIASRIKIQGVYTNRKCNVLKAKGLRNTILNTTINLPIEVYDVLKEIALNNNSSMRSMVIEVLKSLCNIDFNNYTFTENHKVFKKVILKPARIIEHNKHCKYGRLTITTSDLRLSVQMRAIIEKYSIPSINDLLKRIVYFIISVHNGDVKLNSVNILDNEDYNNTRMVRDAYRKEVMYGTHK